MDPANTPLGKMLLDEITPVIMVLSTPLVEEASLKNHLSFVQMLSPFCSFNNIDGNFSLSLSLREMCVLGFDSCVRGLIGSCFLQFVAVPVRTASDQPYRLQKFKLRLFSASDIRQPNLEVIA